MRCTWKDCEREAVKEQVDKNDQRWAFLCVEHDKELDDSITSLDVKRMLST